jgi:hypothetical protein
MTTKTIVDLREKLFNVIDALSDKKSPMDIELAKAICETAQVIVNTAKAESEYIKYAGGRPSGFLGQNAQLKQLPE